jgi:LmbE family N-acetylglucosaminyl deacetylase
VTLGGMDTTPLTTLPAAAGGHRPVDVAGVARLGTTLCVWAHPDDEAYLGGGLMAALRAAGQRVVVATATLGEAGLDGPVAGTGTGHPPPLSRREELAAALRAVGVTEHHLLGFADGGCAGVDPAAGAAAVRRLVTAVRPDTVVTFGPDGFTGHPDHVAVGAWTRQALAGPEWDGRLLNPVMTAADREAGRDVAEPIGAYDLGEPRICRPEELAVRLELTGDLLAAKVAALRAHRSQTAALLEIVGVARFAAWVAVEAFAEVAPDR